MWRLLPGPLCRPGPPQRASLRAGPEVRRRSARSLSSGGAGPRGPIRHACHERPLPVPRCGYPVVGPRAPGGVPHPPPHPLSGGLGPLPHPPAPTQPLCFLAVPMWKWPDFELPLTRVSKLPWFSHAGQSAFPVALQTLWPRPWQVGTRRKGLSSLPLLWALGFRFPLDCCSGSGISSLCLEACGPDWLLPLRPLRPPCPRPLPAPLGMVWARPSAWISLLPLWGASATIRVKPSDRPGGQLSAPLAECPLGPAPVGVGLSPAWPALWLVSTAAPRGAGETRGGLGDSSVARASVGVSGTPERVHTGLCARSA